MTSPDPALEAAEPELSPEEKARSARAYRRLDVVVALLFIALGAIVLQQVATRLPLFRFGQVGPGLLPAGVGLILVVMGAIVVLQNLRGLAAEAGGYMPTLGEAGRVVVLVAMIVGATLLMPLVGTIVALGLFILAETRLLERRPWPVALAAAVLVPLVIYLAFEAALGVPLPRGTFGLI